MQPGRTRRSMTQQAQVVLLALGIAMSAFGVLSGGRSAAASAVGRGSAHHLAAATSSLEGSSCSHPYRYVTDLRKFYNPARIHEPYWNYEGPGRRILSEHINGSLGIGFDHFNSEGLESTPTHPLPITSAEFTAQWWVMPPRQGKTCVVRITFHGLRPYVSHKRLINSGVRIVFHHFRTQWALKLEITSARS
jgi:hypothetical protein